MRYSRYSTQKGFIALFFTLSMSGILLMYVITNSTAVFDFTETRRAFMAHRKDMYINVNCADVFLDIYARTYRYAVFDAVYTFSHEGYMCTVSEIVIRQADDIYWISFVIGGIGILSSIEKGFIQNAFHEDISL